MHTSVLSHTVCSVFACACGFVWLTLLCVCFQRPCKQCGRLYEVKAGERHQRCRTCEHERKYGPSPAAVVPPRHPSPLPIFSSPPLTAHSHLSLMQRSACVVMDAEGQLRKDIAAKVGTSIPSVRHWVNHYAEHKHVKDEPRSGRPRETDDATDTNIALTAIEEGFISARGVKRKLGLDVSIDTVDRRLIEGGLPGRVAQHFFAYTDEHKRKRLAFAEKYKDWSEEKWDKVIFSDEKIFWGSGFSGQVWVRRPVGEAMNPKYCVDQKPHPIKVSMWGSFCGRGLCYSYIFNKTMDAKLFVEILSTHLKQSAALYYQTDPPEQWYFLQDNAPQHNSIKARTWLHNNGISVLDFPPYSPDLNPIENLWNHLARVVETAQATTMEELQDVVAEAWKKTELSFIQTLVHSMPKRCKAVIEAQGEHTKY